ncbi:basic proline-rich protein-like [Corapipo altera]|uniref:basic proline-rich protein-like n=1 Tax=Corapipo altera TaxID=415028 RepID=UPI000FD6B149|nr:basic proline-rich protein-like [Corapipo altera]
MVCRFIFHTLVLHTFIFTFTSDVQQYGQRRGPGAAQPELPQQHLRGQARPGRVPPPGDGRGQGRGEPRGPGSPCPPCPARQPCWGGLEAAPGLPGGTSGPDSPQPGSIPRGPPSAGAGAAAGGAGSSGLPLGSPLPGAPSPRRSCRAPAPLTPSLPPGLARAAPLLTPPRGRSPPPLPPPPPPLPPPPPHSRLETVGTDAPPCRPLPRLRAGPPSRPAARGPSLPAGRGDPPPGGLPRDVPADGAGLVGGVRRREPERSDAEGETNRAKEARRHSGRVWEGWKGKSK